MTKTHEVMKILVGVAAAYACAQALADPNKPAAVLAYGSYASSNSRKRIAKIRSRTATRKLLRLMRYAALRAMRSRLRPGN
jgi:hypothetical protein